MISFVTDLKYKVIIGIGVHIEKPVINTKLNERAKAGARSLRFIQLLKMQVGTTVLAKSQVTLAEHNVSNCSIRVIK